MELAADRNGETAGGCEREADEGALTRATQGRTKTAKGDEQIPRTPPVNRIAGRRPGRENHARARARNVRCPKNTRHE
jgi:hypothetical protein